MKNETIDAIIKLAIAAYNNKHKPGEFARKAAHKAALDAAKEYNSDLADFATLNAAAELHFEIACAVNFTSKVTDKAVSMVGAYNNYQALWEKYAHTVIPKHITDDYFGQLAQSSDKISRALVENIAPTYDTTSVLDVVSRNKAKRAALYVYLDTYAVTRAAYRRAMFAAQNTSGLKQLYIFQETIAKTLKKDLTYDTIHPGLIFALLNNFIFKVLLTITLLVSIAAILLAVFNLTPIPFLPLICAGSGATALSIGLGVGSFFAKKKCDQLAIENANRAENAIYI